MFNIFLLVKANLLLDDITAKFNKVQADFNPSKEYIIRNIDPIDQPSKKQKTSQFTASQYTRSQTGAINKEDAKHYSYESNDQSDDSDFDCGDDESDISSEFDCGDGQRIKKIELIQLNL
jgi:hypothetical protein